MPLRWLLIKLNERGWCSATDAFVQKDILEHSRGSDEAGQEELLTAHSRSPELRVNVRNAANGFY